MLLWDYGSRIGICCDFSKMVSTYMACELPVVSWFPHEICFGFYNVSTCSAFFAMQCKMHFISTWNHRKPCSHIEFRFPHGTMFTQVMSHFHPLCFQWLVYLMICFLRLALLLHFLVFLQVYLVFCSF